MESSGTMADVLLEAISDGVSVIDAQGVHLQVNAALTAMVGWSQEELRSHGPPPHAYWPPEHMAGIDDALRRTTTGEEGPHEMFFG